MTDHPLDTDVPLATARTAYARGEWDRAVREYSRIHAAEGLALEDLDRLGSSLWWVGETAESLVISEDVYHRYEDSGEDARAAMKALKLGLLWFIRGDQVIASGWASRARRNLAVLPESAEHGFLLYLDAAVAFSEGDTGPARDAVVPLEELGRRVHAPPLQALSLVLAGMVDLVEARTVTGFAKLDEAMLPVLAGQLDPEWAGDVYCTVIHACHRLADVPRMRSWTRATEQWCRQFQGEVVYTGICRVHRLQLMCAEGHWGEAEEAIERCGAELVGTNNWVAGEAYYQLGEIRRLRGDHAAAVAAFGRARDLGTDPQPGEALLQHADGLTEAAWSGLCSALAGRDRLAAASLLGAGVGLALALGKGEEAEYLCAELEATAEGFGSPGFRAWAAHARAALLVAEGHYGEAIPVLEGVAADYRTLRLRYESAGVQELLSRAFEGLGDAGAAATHRSRALATYRELGAAPDIARLDAAERLRVGVSRAGAPGGLTGREVEVLRQIAGGASNRAAAEALFISQKTVGRHLANIFTKIGVSSRTAAAAWAHEHGL